MCCKVKPKRYLQLIDNSDLWINVFHWLVGDVGRPCCIVERGDALLEKAVGGSDAGNHQAVAVAAQ